MIRYFLLAIMLLTCGCMKHTITNESSCAFEPPQNAWFKQQGTYALRHDGILKVGGKVIPMTGFMTLDMDTHTAAVAIMKGLGMKLVTMEVTPEDYRVFEMGPLPRHIPHFAEECAKSIRAMFLTTPPIENTRCDTDYILTEATSRGRIRATFAKETEQLVQLTSNEWNATYESGTLFPARITFRSKSRRYEIILKLNHAEKR